MAFFGKTYTLVKNENFDAWLKSNGVSDDQAAAILGEKSSVKIVNNGDSYVLTQSGAKGDKETTFKSGVEIDDTVGLENIPVKSIFTVSGNTVTQVIKAGLGTATFKREFNGDDLVVTITGDKYDGVAKRYYKA